MSDQFGFIVCTSDNRSLCCVLWRSARYLNSLLASLPRRFQPRSCRFKRTLYDGCKFHLHFSRRIVFVFNGRLFCTRGPTTEGPPMRLCSSRSAIIPFFRHWLDLSPRWMRFLVILVKVSYTGMVPASPQS